MEKVILIKAGGGVVYCRKGGGLQVLLIHRRGVWDLPKGKVERDETVEEGAVREIEEETGCRGTRITGYLGTTEHFYRENGVKYKKITWWYAMQCRMADLRPQKEEQIDELRWMTLDEARKNVYYSNLKKVLSWFGEEAEKKSDTNPE